MKTALLKTNPKREDMMRNFLPLVSDHGPANRAKRTEGTDCRRLL